MISGRAFRRGKYWYLGWHENGRWINKTTHIQSENDNPPPEVLKQLLELKERLKCGKTGEIYIPKITIKGALTEWLDLDRKIHKDTPATYANHLCHVPRWFEPTKDKLVSHFTEADVSDIVAAINQRPTTFRGNKNIYSSITQFWQFCVDKGYSKRNVFKLSNAKDRISGSREAKLERRALTYEEQNAIFSFLKGWPLTCAMIAIWTGARASEAVKVQLEDVDFMKKKIRFVEKKLHGRIIWKPIHPILHDYLRSIGPDDYPPAGKKPINLSEIFSRAALKAKVKNATFHWLRHTLASRLFDEGVSERDAAAILGHTVEVHRIYAHANHTRLLDNLGRVKSDRVLIGSSDKNGNLMLPDAHITLPDEKPEQV